MRLPAPTAVASKSYVTLQFCRAVAALLVVAYHTAGNLAKENYFGTAAAPIEAVWRFGGTAGVAFFFVLSGFIIAHVHHRDFDHPRRLGAYLRKRLVRIYPSFILIFLAVYALAWLSPTLREKLPTDPFVVLKALLLLPQDPQKTGSLGAPVLIVAWSLHYEMLFYAAIALAIVRRWLLVPTVVVFLVNFALVQQSAALSFPQTFFANPLIFLFGMGIAVAALARRPQPLPMPIISITLAAAAFLGVGISEALIGWSIHVPLLEIAYGITGSALLLALVRYEDGRQTPVRNATVSLLGDASYALYLLHFPLIAVLCKLLIAIGWHGAIGAQLGFWIVVISCTVGAVVFHLCIERPLVRSLSAI